ncbi:MAG: GNAT family N-acetyltransferase, partial [Actinomycetota bacterium]
MADVPVVVARQAAAAAAERSGVIVRPSEGRGDEDAVRAVFDEVWPGDQGTQVTSNLLHALVHSGSYASLAVDSTSGEPLGAALGFPGHRPDVPGRLYLHSHMAAVRESLRNRRVGTALKLHQRR